MAQHARRVRVREEENNALMHYGKITFIVSESIYIYIHSLYLSCIHTDKHCLVCKMERVRKRVGGGSVCAHRKGGREKGRKRVPLWS